MVQQDDAVIGRATKKSLIALIVIGLIAAGTWFLLTPKKAAPIVQITPLSAPSAAPASTPEIPEARFVDITREAGIHFVHQSGATGEKLLPETMGAGVAFLDFDNDHAPDLLFANGTSWPWNPAAPSQTATPALYRNDGKGRFHDVTATSGLNTSFYGTGLAVGDYDNDGWTDIFFCGVGGNRLFRNLGQGRFADMTASAGVAGSSDDWSSSTSFLDFDNDGDLDLFVCHYVKWSRDIDFKVGYKLVGVGRAYGPPMNFGGTFPSLFRNEGGGKFTDVSASAGVQIKNPATGVPTAKSLGVAPIDLDSDGWIDLVIANDTVQNFVFHNQKNGTFKEIGALCGIAFDAYGMTRGAMGIDAARHRNDDTLGIGIGNFANEMTALYVSQKMPMTFADEAIPEGVGPASRLLLKFGLVFLDYDLDGRLDLLTANGHLEEEINKVQQSQQYRQPAQLFWNSGVGFQSVPPSKVGSDLFRPIVGRGVAYADIDGDGDPDVVLTQVSGPPLLLRNDQSLGQSWVKFKLVGKSSTRSAIGAWVTLKRGTETLSQQVMPTRGYLSQSETILTFGLGRESKLDSAEILWPGGKKQILTAPRLGQLNIVEESP
ncbi:MAG: CRTAC1 family protein [Verrucomicrobia bacterium]|nr:CRTAC1 family protein [Verrucomicrobiota bacterium]